MLKAWGMQKAQYVILLGHAGCRERRYVIKPVIYSILLESNYS
jgi:hypothetical protein